MTPDPFHCRIDRQTHFRLGQTSQFLATPSLPSVSGSSAVTNAGMGVMGAMDEMDAMDAMDEMGVTDDLCGTTETLAVRVDCKKARSRTEALNPARPIPLGMATGLRQLRDNPRWSVSDHLVMPPPTGKLIAQPNSTHPRTLRQQLLRRKNPS
jgi:hypothetical protein